VPDIKIENDEAKFGLPESKIHVLVHNAALMALVNTTGKKLDAYQARHVAERENPARRMPEFLAFISDQAATLKAVYEKEPRVLPFADQAEVSAASVAAWIASAARRVQMAQVKTGLASGILQMLVFKCVELLFVALVAALAGLIASTVLRAGLAFGEALTIGVYAATPGWLVLPVLVLAVGLGTDWLSIACFAVQMVYTVLAVHYTAREQRAEAAPAL
jgi:hypothetical protein